MAVSYPVLSIEEARAYEGEVLGEDIDLIRQAMTNAGQAIGEAILADYQEIRDWPDYPSILILAGKGLNSGDAFVACKLMQEVLGDLHVNIVMTEEASNLSPLAAEALEALQTVLGGDLDLLTVDAYLARVPEPLDLVMDGLYGHGFRPPLSALAAELLQHVNQRTDVLLRAAIDLPSGLGTGVDENCFVADITYVPGVAKAPCFERAHAHLVGRVRFLEIPPFLDPPTREHRVLLASPSSHRDLNTLRGAQSDKRTYGHCLLLAGSADMPGAAIMATHGALLAGAGLVTTCLSGRLAGDIAPAAPEAMWRSLPVTSEGDLDPEAVRIVLSAAEKCDAVLVGPGLVVSRASTPVLSRILRQLSLPVVVDASALVPTIVETLAGRADSAGPVVLTPHLGEFSRLAGIPVRDVTDERLIEYSQKYRVTTVLKGHPTRISDGETCHFAPVGGPVLARGGAGDILAGMLTTLLAQSPDDPLSAAVNAVCWHGAAADMLARERGATAVKTTDLLVYLADALRTRF